MSHVAPRAVRLICLDVDGTLLGASGVVRDAVWRAAERARAAGLRLVLCSGRPGFGVTRDLARQVDPDGWHCFQNGASVLHLATGESRSSELPAESLAMLVARARAVDRPLELYTDDDYATESPSEVARLHAALLGLPFVPRPYDTLPPPVVRAQWLLTRDELDGVLAEPHPGLEVSPSLGPALPEHVFVNLTRGGVDKGSAVRAIAAAYGVELRDVMYVGDGFNDTPALRIVGWPVAMANAEPAALALARHVVGSVEEDGVAEALALAMASAEGVAADGGRRAGPRVLPLDLAHAPPEALAAAAAHERRASLTNMKRTLLHSVPAFDALMSWYTLRDAIAPVIGERAVLIYCFAVSERADCLICSTFFRRLLVQRGEDPGALVLSEQEEALAAFGRQLATPPFTVDDRSWSLVSASLTDEQVVTLASFGAIMLATNVFNNVMGVPLDEYLRPYLTAERPAGE